MNKTRRSAQFLRSISSLEVELQPSKLSTRVRFPADAFLSFWLDGSECIRATVKGGVRGWGYNNTMNLKQRMEHQNRNNSSIINNSNFDFAQASKEDQIYERSRRECEEELIKRKNELEYERANMLKIREKELGSALEKFNADFEEIRKQILNLINQHLTETKARMLAEIKERRSADSAEEGSIKKQIDEMLGRINTNLMGLKQNQYREYIAKIVTTDFDSGKEEVKQAVRKLKYPVSAAVVDEKTYNCFRSDLAKLVQLSFSRSDYAEGVAKESASEYLSVNMHQNRDKLKKVPY